MKSLMLMLIFVLFGAAEALSFEYVCILKKEKIVVEAYDKKEGCEVKMYKNDKAGKVIARYKMSRDKCVEEVNKLVKKLEEKAGFTCTFVEEEVTLEKSPEVKK